MPSEIFSWIWWTKSTQGLLARIAIGAAIFAVLATVDLVCHGKKATRWREYLFLVAGVVATWTAGLIVSVALLIANNPRPNRPRLPYRMLLSQFGFVALIAVCCSIILGIVGYLGGLTWISSDFRWLVHENLMRPSHFMCVFGIHLGAYLGGALGVIISVRNVLVKRKRLASA